MKAEQLHRYLKSLFDPDFRCNQCRHIIPYGMEMHRCDTKSIAVEPDQKKCQLFETNFNFRNAKIIHYKEFEASISTACSESIHDITVGYTMKFREVNCLVCIENIRTNRVHFKENKAGGSATTLCGLSVYGKTITFDDGMIIMGADTLYSAQSSEVTCVECICQLAIQSHEKISGGKI